MSGLVSGLQNRARRFESACDLRKGYVQIEHILFLLHCKVCSAPLCLILSHLFVNFALLRQHLCRTVFLITPL